MKHPVNTSTWGEFKVGELFDCQTTKTMNPSKNGLSEGEIPYVTRSAFNNGISGSYSDPTGEFTTERNCITIGAEGAIAFYQDTDFIAGVKVYALRHERLNHLSALFVCSILNENARSYSYTNARVLDKIKEETIPLPLKQGTNLADYSQEDIDWDYMESFMSRVQDAAKERLANLPEPGQKSKTPVDVNKWGEFDVIALFDIINTKSIRQSDVQAQLLSNNGSTPYITASDKNNAILAYIECPQEWIDEGNCIFIGGKTTTITYQQKDFCSNDSHNLALYLKHKQARTKHIQLYLVSIFKKTFAKYHWGDALSKTKIKTESIKLPLKSSADPSNYTQDDIDWDYMESFMSQFQNLAKNRVERLTSAHDCDILTV